MNHTKSDARRTHLQPTIACANALQDVICSLFVRQTHSSFTDVDQRNEICFLGLQFGIRQGTKLRSGLVWHDCLSFLSQDVDIFRHWYA